MIFEKLILENFGPYRGKHEILLRPTRGADGHKPIILIGGRNSYGKTTIYDAIKTCLYGIEIYGSRRKKSEYEDYIRHKIIDINEDLGQQLLSAKKGSVELVLERSLQGKLEKYKIRREWTITIQNAVNETLYIEKDGKPFSEVEVSLWHDFIKDLIPIEIAWLFFFDGEKIQELAENPKTPREYLKKSFKQLLGLKIIEQLRIDLKQYSKQLIEKTSKRDDIIQALSRTSVEMEKLERQKERLLYEKTEIMTQITLLTNKIEEKESELSALGGIAATRRKELQEELKALEKQILKQEENIRFFASDLFPFVLAPKLVSSLKNRLSFEQEYLKKIESLSIIKKFTRELLQTLESEDFSGVGDINLAKKMQKTLEHRIQDILEAMLPKSSENLHIVPFLSPREIYKVLDGIEKIEKGIADDFIAHCIELEKFYAKYNEIKKHLEEQPADDVVAPILAEINALNKEMGMFEQKLNDVEDSFRKIEKDIKDLEREKEKLEKQFLEMEKSVISLELLKRSRMVLDEYVERLYRKKIEEFKKVFLDTYNCLMPENDLVYGIEIDSQNFNIAMLDKKGRKLKVKTRFSAGEKQLYAISLLWTLIKLSRRHIPIVIDTPLARLDEKNRMTLCREFFPHVSHQVIILSTDEEVDGNLYKMLLPHISHAYHLIKPSKKSPTTIQDGYFRQISEES